jgi:WD40 repeat protein
VSEADDGRQYFGAFFSTDGDHVIAEQGVPPEDPRRDCEFESFRILQAKTGEIIRETPSPRATGFWAGPAQTGPRVDLARPLIRGEMGEGCDDSGGVGDLVGLDLLSGERTILGTGATFNNRSTGVPTVSADGSRLATTGDSTPGAVTDLRTGDELLALPSGISTLSSDGSLVLAGNNPLELWHVDRQERLRDFQGDFSIAWFSPSERLVYGATFDGRVVVFDLESGALLFELRGHTSRVVELQMTQDESKIATFAFDGTARVWDIGSAWTSTTGPESFDAYLGDLYATFGVSNTYVTSDALLAERIIWDRGSLLFETTSYDPETGQDLTTYPGLLLAVSHDEEHVALQETGSLRELSDEEAGGPGTGGFYTRIGGFRIADLTTGATVVELEGLCDWYFKLRGGVPYGIVPTEDCEVDGIPWRELSTVGTFSPDDSMFAMAGQSGRFAVWDTSSGAIVWTLGDGDERLPPGSEGEVEFSPDGNHLLLSQGPNIEVWDTSTWTKVAEFSITREPDEMEFTPDGSQLVLTDGEVVIFDTQTWQETARLPGQQGAQIRDMAVDPTGRFAATAGWDSESWVWDLERREVVHRLSFPALYGGMRNIQWFDEETLVLGSEDWAVMMSLNPEVLAQNARDRLTRSFTAEECNTYDIDPCPTLEELKLGS